MCSYDRECLLAVLFRKSHRVSLAGTGLRILQSHQIVHRDLKPEVLLLVRSIFYMSYSF